jgi:hypothetical protein
MKRVVSRFLNLVVIVNFLPCFTMEKEKSPIHADNALKTAAQENNVGMVMKALRYRATIDAPDEHGNTGLHYAMYNGNVRIINLLHNAQPSIHNKYRNIPIFYLNSAMNAHEQNTIITDTIKKSISDQMRQDLKETKKISDKQLNQTQNNDDLLELFNLIIGGEEKKYYLPFYEDFLRQVSTFILLALDEKPNKVIEEKYNDPLAPLFDISLAKNKASHLLGILKIMNSVAFNFFKKQLTLSKKHYKAQFGRLSLLEKDPGTQLIASYISQIKVIVNKLDLYKKETNNEMIRSFNAYQDKEQAFQNKKQEWLAYPFASFVALLIEGKTHTLLSLDKDKKKMLIAIHVPESEISRDLFALAFTSFAQSRKHKINMENS